MGLHRTAGAVAGPALPPVPAAGSDCPKRQFRDVQNTDLSVTLGLLTSNFSFLSLLILLKKKKESRNPPL